jgi:hypothetical protein
MHNHPILYLVGTNHGFKSVTTEVAFPMMLYNSTVKKVRESLQFGKGYPGWGREIAVPFLTLSEVSIYVCITVA